MIDIALRPNLFSNRRRMGRPRDLTLIDVSLWRISVTRQPSREPLFDACHR